MSDKQTKVFNIRLYLLKYNYQKYKEMKKIHNDNEISEKAKAI